MFDGSDAPLITPRFYRSTDVDGVAANNIYLSREYYMDDAERGRAKLIQYGWSLRE